MTPASAAWPFVTRRAAGRDEAASDIPGARGSTCLLRSCCRRFPARWYSLVGGGPNRRGGFDPLLATLRSAASLGAQIALPDQAVLQLRTRGDRGSPHAVEGGGRAGTTMSHADCTEEFPSHSAMRSQARRLGTPTFTSVPMMRVVRERRLSATRVGVSCTSSSIACSVTSIPHASLCRSLLLSPLLLLTTQSGCHGDLGHFAWLILWSVAGRFPHRARTS